MSCDFYIVRCLMQQGEMTTLDLIKQTGFHRNAILRRLKAASLIGVVEIVREGSGNRPNLWRLANQRKAR